MKTYWKQIVHHQLKLSLKIMTPAHYYTISQPYMVAQMAVPGDWHKAVKMKRRPAEADPLYIKLQPFPQILVRGGDHRAADGAPHARLR